MNKTDPNDALGLAQIVRTGWYREVTVKSLDSQVVRSFLTARARLVEMRVDLTNQIRGMLKPFGLVAGKGGGQPFIHRVRTLVADGPLKDVVEALLSALQAVSRQIGILTCRLMALARQDPAARRLMTAPGVGSLVALAYISIIDAPERFSKSSSVGAYLGLPPRRYQSGEIAEAVESPNAAIRSCEPTSLRRRASFSTASRAGRRSKLGGRGLPGRSVERRPWWRSPVSCRSSSTECGTMIPTSAGPTRRGCRHEIVTHEVRRLAE